MYAMVPYKHYGFHFYPFIWEGAQVKHTLAQCVSHLHHHSQNLPYDTKETNISIMSQVAQNYFVHQMKPPPHAQNYTPVR
jgi:hypothetical protein